jgi:fumarate hydratase class II
MNVNEVIARLARTSAGRSVHPNDDVNMGQSSNDVIPTAIHVSAYVELERALRPAVDHLAATLGALASRVDHVVVTGRTHLMDALPLRLSQEVGGWRRQVERALEGVSATAPRLAELAVGGTAVGTGLNAHPELGRRVTARIARITGLPFVEARDHFALQSSQDTAVELSGQLRVLAVALMKIANDLRLMNSGPDFGLGEIALPALQPGSSMMPGKVNPVIPEAVAMACARVIGNDTTVAIAGQSGSFQLNTMLPLIAHGLHDSLGLLTRAARTLADAAIRDLVVNEARIRTGLERNPVLVTALSPIIGYELAARIVQRARAEDRAVRVVAAEMTNLPAERLEQLLDPRTLTEPGIPGLT